MSYNGFESHLVRAISPFKSSPIKALLLAQEPLSHMRLRPSQLLQRERVLLHGRALWCSRRYRQQFGRRGVPRGPVREDLGPPKSQKTLNNMWKRVAFDAENRSFSSGFKGGRRAGKRPRHLAGLEVFGELGLTAFSYIDGLFTASIDL